VGVKLLSKLRTQYSLAPNPDATTLRCLNHAVHPSNGRGFIQSRSTPSEDIHRKHLFNPSARPDSTLPILANQFSSE